MTSWAARRVLARGYEGEEYHHPNGPEGEWYFFWRYGTYTLGRYAVTVDEAMDLAACAVLEDDTRPI